MLFLHKSVWLAMLILIANISTLVAQDDVADVKSQDIRIGNDEHQRYFLIGPNAEEKAPAKGYGLIVVLPGGDGSADFNPFVKRIFKFATPKGYLLAQPVAVMWTKNQPVTWPTAKSTVAGKKFSTEEFVDAVIDDVAKHEKINPKHVFTLSWSSGGPAAYAISTSNGKVTGSFIAMSIFHPSELTMANAKGHAYYLYHSPDDHTCPFRMSEEAVKALEAEGAKVTLTKYDGGHGWHGDVFGDISAGFDWLEKNAAE
jgi:predicted esterase